MPEFSKFTKYRLKKKFDLRYLLGFFVLGLLLLGGTSGVYLAQKNTDLYKRADGNKCYTEWSGQCCDQGPPVCAHSWSEGYYQEITDQNEAAKWAAISGDSGSSGGGGSSTPVQTTTTTAVNTCSGISCSGGCCADGWCYGADPCAPQSSCAQRAAEACASHSGTGSGGGSTSSTGGAAATGDSSGGGASSAPATTADQSGTYPCYASNGQFCGYRSQHNNISCPELCAQTVNQSWTSSSGADSGTTYDASTWSGTSTSTSNTGGVSQTTTSQDSSSQVSSGSVSTTSQCRYPCVCNDGSIYCREANGNQDCITLCQGKNTAWANVCGDGWCNKGEDAILCPQDCGEGTAANSKLDNGQCLIQNADCSGGKICCSGLTCVGSTCQPQAGALSTQDDSTVTVASSLDYNPSGGQTVTASQTQTASQECVQNSGSWNNWTGTCTYQDPIDQSGPGYTVALNDEISIDPDSALYYQAQNAGLDPSDLSNQEELKAFVAEQVAKVAQQKEDDCVTRCLTNRAGNEAECKQSCQTDKSSGQYTQTQTCETLGCPDGYSCVDQTCQQNTALQNALASVREIVETAADKVMTGKKFCTVFEDNKCQVKEVDASRHCQYNSLQACQDENVKRQETLLATDIYQCSQEYAHSGGELSADCLEILKVDSRSQLTQDSAKLTCVYAVAGFDAYDTEYIQETIQGELCNQALATASTTSIASTDTEVEDSALPTIAEAQAARQQGDLGELNESCNNSGECLEDLVCISHSCQNIPHALMAFDISSGDTCYQLAGCVCQDTTSQIGNGEICPPTEKELGLEATNQKLAEYYQAKGEVALAKKAAEIAAYKQAKKLAVEQRAYDEADAPAGSFDRCYRIAAGGCKSYVPTAGQFEDCEFTDIDSCNANYQEKVSAAIESTVSSGIIVCEVNGQSKYVQTYAECYWDGGHITEAVKADSQGRTKCVSPAGSVGSCRESDGQYLRCVLSPAGQLLWQGDPTCTDVPLVREESKSFLSPLSKSLNNLAGIVIDSMTKTLTGKSQEELEEIQTASLFTKCDAKSDDICRCGVGIIKGGESCNLVTMARDVEINLNKDSGYFQITNTGQIESCSLKERLAKGNECDLTLERKEELIMQAETAVVDYSALLEANFAREVRFCTDTSGNRTLTGVSPTILALPEGAHRCLEPGSLTVNLGIECDNGRRWNEDLGRCLSSQDLIDLAKEADQTSANALKEVELAKLAEWAKQEQERYSQLMSAYRIYCENDNICGDQKCVDNICQDPLFGVTVYDLPAGEICYEAFGCRCQDSTKRIWSGEVCPGVSEAERERLISYVSASNPAIVGNEAVINAFLNDQISAEKTEQNRKKCMVDDKEVYVNTESICNSLGGRLENWTIGFLNSGGAPAIIRQTAEAIGNAGSTITDWVTGQNKNPAAAELNACKNATCGDYANSDCVADTGFRCVCDPGLSDGDYPIGIFERDQSCSLEQATYEANEAALLTQRAEDFQAEQAAKTDLVGVGYSLNLAGEKTYYCFDPEMRQNVVCDPVIYNADLQDDLYIKNRDVCDNGVCETFENQLTCPADCKPKDVGTAASDSLNKLTGLSSRFYNLINPQSASSQKTVKDESSSQLNEAAKERYAVKFHTCANQLFYGLALEDLGECQQILGVKENATEINSENEACLNVIAVSGVGDAQGHIESDLCSSMVANSQEGRELYDLANPDNQQQNPCYEGQRIDECICRSPMMRLERAGTNYRVCVSRCNPGQAIFEDNVQVCHCDRKQGLDNVDGICQ